MLYSDWCSAAASHQPVSMAVMKVIKMEFIQIIVILLSLLAAILAWAAKIIWSRQYSKAKDERIKALNKQIELLKEFSPIKIREYFLSVKEQLEEYNEHLKEKLKKANIKIDEHENSDERFNKILEMIVGIDVKTNKYLDELETYSKEIELIQRAVKDDSFELPSIILKPSRDEIEKYITKTIPNGISKNRSTIDLSKWASKHHPAYKK